MATNRPLHYLKRKDIGKIYPIGDSSSSKYLNDIEKSGRYPDGSIIRMAGGSMLVLDTVIHDYLQNRWKLIHGVKVEPYSAEETVRQMKRLAI